VTQRDVLAVEKLVVLVRQSLYISLGRERERDGDLGLSTETDVGSHDEDAKPKGGNGVC
jgi:hypothetical protein